jgi:hypothetical protein
MIFSVLPIIGGQLQMLLYAKLVPFIDEARQEKSIREQFKVPIIFAIFLPHFNRAENWDEFILEK